MINTLNKLLAIALSLQGMRFFLLVFSVIIFVPGKSFSADIRSSNDIRDLFFGEALFHYYQKNYFSAVALLDAELAQLYSLDDPKQDSLSYHREESELIIADMELSYRMHQKVGRAMQRLLDKSVHESIRDRAAFRLARIAFKKSSYENALSHLGHIGKKAPEKLRDKATLLRGQSLIALGRDEEAIKVLMPARNVSALSGYAPYNLGVAFMGAGDTVSAFRHLNEVGTMQANSSDIAALRDKANLTIGASLLKDEKPVKARTYLERVQLKSAFSNKALLWAGWSSAAEGKYDQALVPWMILRKRDITDVAVQEAYLAAPYAFGQLQAYGKSAVLYGEAVDKIDHEISRLDNSIRSVREGKLLKAMLSDEAERQEQWLFKLGATADAPETRYLRNLMAGHSFNESYQNYRELDQLRRNIDRGLRDLAAYRNLLLQRKNYFAPLLETTEGAYVRVQKRLSRTLEARDKIARRLNMLLRKREPMELATFSEKKLLDGLKRSGKRISRLHSRKEKIILSDKQALLEGLLRWDIEAGYENRISSAHKHLRELDKEIVKLKQNRKLLIKAKSEAALSYQGYGRALEELQERLLYLKDKSTGLMAHQGQYMERRAISELNRRKQRLQRYRTKARFAMAESYDLAVRAQSGKKK